jgi:pleiotropic regulator 1
MATSSALPPLEPLILRNAEHARAVFSSNPNEGMKDEEIRHAPPRITLTIALNDAILLSTRLGLAVKIYDEYRHYKQLPPALLAQQAPVGPTRPNQQHLKAITAGREFSFHHGENADS